MSIIIQPTLFKPVKNVQKEFVSAALTGSVEFTSTDITVCSVMFSVIMAVHALSMAANNFLLGLVALQISMKTPATSQV